MAMKRHSRKSQPRKCIKYLNRMYARQIQQFELDERDKHRRLYPEPEQNATYRP